MAYCNNKAQEKARHSRVRHPNDDAHIERFNRILRRECISRYNPNKKNRRHRAQTKALHQLLQL